MNKKLFAILALIPMVTSCNLPTNSSESSSSSSESSSQTSLASSSSEESQESSSSDSAELKAKKSNAIGELNDYLNKDLYDKEEQDEIDLILVEGMMKINRCKTIADVDNTLNTYEDKLLEVKTTKQKELDSLKGEKTILEAYKTTEQIESFKSQGYTNLYADPTYQNGFIVTKNSTSGNPYHDEPLRFYESNSNTPNWTIAQWSTKYDIMDSSSANGGYTLTRSEDGLVNTITSKGKTVNGTFVPGKVVTLNTKTGSVYFECNTSVEYDTPRTGSEGWVHLLLSQDFGNNLVNVSSCSSIVMDCKFTVNKCENHTGSAYDTSKHAAQVVWYITLQNRNQNSAGYGKYIWFGIGLWDNRSEGKKSAAYIAHDAGTDTLIYNPASTVYYTDTLGFLPKVGKEGHANVDIWPIAKQAFNEAKQKGYLANTNWEDLYIGGTNFGYEVPGTFDIATTFECINVFYK